ncbi:MAG: radical SAM protein [Deltaproteobacteria bacterium]|nr:radical SAM protein [Deltaproteobacteria bacterium]
MRRRLGREIGRIDKQAPFAVALAYPASYAVGMSSLGFQRIYRAIQAEPDMACERAFLPDRAGSGSLRGPVLSYERLRPLGDFPVVAFSVAYELELGALVQMLGAARIPGLREQRDERHPFVLAGGPLTFANPLPLGALADAVVVGEADALGVQVLRVLRDAGGRRAALHQLAALAGVFVPARHGSSLPELARCDDALLPAFSAISTPEAELGDMFLVEAERGCSRGCAYCVMRRSAMRTVAAERILELVPPGAKRVGLVGAAVSDHPRIGWLVRALAQRGIEVGLSSLRPDRLSEELVAALRPARSRTLTTALDAPSARLRERLGRDVSEEHALRAAELAREHGLLRLKLYLMVGLPGETDADVDEGAALVTRLSRLVPVSLGVAPFCAKRGTPLQGQPYAGIGTVGARIARLRRALAGRAEVRATSPRWAWVEHALAQGGLRQGQAVWKAVCEGGRFRDYQAALAHAATAPAGASVL